MFQGLVTPSERSGKAANYAANKADELKTYANVTFKVRDGQLRVASKQPNDELYSIRNNADKVLIASDLGIDAVEQHIANHY